MSTQTTSPVVNFRQTSDNGFIITQQLKTTQPGLSAQQIEQVALDFPTAITKLAAIYGITLTITVTQQAQVAQPTVASATAATATAAAPAVLSASAPAS